MVATSGESCGAFSLFKMIQKSEFYVKYLNFYVSAINGSEQIS